MYHQVVIFGFYWCSEHIHKLLYGDQKKNKKNTKYVVCYLEINRRSSGNNTRGYVILQTALSSSNGIYKLETQAILKWRVKSEEWSHISRNSCINLVPKCR